MQSTTHTVSIEAVRGGRFQAVCNDCHWKGLHEDTARVAEEMSANHVAESPRLTRPADVAPAGAVAGDDRGARPSLSIRFVPNPNGPARLVTDAEIVFDGTGTPLDGMKLVGFSLWRTPEGDLMVTMPSRAFGAGNERRFFDYVRPNEGRGQARDVKAWILNAYRESRGEAQ